MVLISCPSVFMNIPVSNELLLAFMHRNSDVMYLHHKKATLKKLLETILQFIKFRTTKTMD